MGWENCPKYMQYWIKFLEGKPTAQPCGVCPYNEEKCGMRKGENDEGNKE